MTKQIRLEDDVYDALDRERRKDETYSQVTRRMIDVVRATRVTTAIYEGERQESASALKEG